MAAHITLDADESALLITCLMNASDVGGSTGNLHLVARAVYLVDLIIDKWIDARRRR